jgi:tRNA-uridine 2-sulfurtransferase
MAPRIVVGMSGGVDSSVAALLLREKGWDVIGVTLHLWDYTKEGHAGRCCAPEDQYDAARVCAALDIPHYTFDRRELFRERVVDRFVSDYVAGRTPSPCVRCNESVKLGPLLEIAHKLGAERVATGHYARVSHDGDGVDLRVARDGDKDQSYFLWPAPMEALRMLELPLGAMTKPEARAEAARFGLVNADKPDSSDLCFVEGDAYTSFVESHAKKLGPAGTIETLDGHVVGEHQGVHAYTVGQRKGTGAGGPARYVLKIVAERAAVIVGSAEEATMSTCDVSEVRWLTHERPEEVLVKVRYRHPGVRARIHATEENRATLTFEEPQRGVAPGQAAVMYVGERLVAGSFIA